jgi:hypothetical protein
VFIVAINFKTVRDNIAAFIESNCSKQVPQSRTTKNTVPHKPKPIEKNKNKDKELELNFSIIRRLPAIRL